MKRIALVNRLKLKVFASIFILVLLSGATLAILSAHYYWQSQKETMEAESRALAQRLSYLLIEKVLINDLVGVQRLLDSQQASDRRVGYLLLIRHGEVLGHTFRLGVPVAFLEDIPGMQTEAPQISELASLAGERYMDVVWPMMGGQAGILRLGLKERTFIEKLREMLFKLGLITLVVLFLSLGLALLFARQLARPLEQLVVAAEKVADGDWRSRVEVNPAMGEAARLGLSFNRMLDRLAEKASQLEKRHNDLERAHRQMRVSCDIMQEIGTLDDAREINSVLLDRLKGSLRCGNALLVAPLKDEEGLLVMLGKRVEVLETPETVGQVLYMLTTHDRSCFLKPGDLPFALGTHLDSNGQRVAFVPFPIEGRMPGALFISCRPDRPCEHCEIGFAESVLRQLNGVLPRVLRQVEDGLRLAGGGGKEEGFCGMIGRDPGMKRVYQLIRDVAPTDSTVLILGESGTGKELVARAIHMSSPRNQSPFVVIDCSAYPATLLESELFGHEKGAFTGAVRTKPGRFELAQGGIVFLDEVGEIPLSAQTKLLRVLQTHRFERLGGERTLEMDVRILAATNKDLLEEVKAGRFREDLYYRLNVFPLNLPPLRQRINDIALLALRFLEHFAAEQGKKLDGFSSEALRLLLDHPWPGNVRELENTVERAAILAKEGLVQPWDLPDGLREATHSTSALDKSERQTIADVLESCAWNKKLAANHLGISRTTLYRKIRKYRLEEPTRH